MDRVTVAALVFAVASVVVAVVRSDDAESPIRHAMVLFFPVALIAFPEAIESGFRSTFRGMTHGGELPTPAAMLRVAAWVLLVVLSIAYHTSS